MIVDCTFVEMLQSGLFNNWGDDGREHVVNEVIVLGSIEVVLDNATRL